MSPVCLVTTHFACMILCSANIMIHWTNVSLQSGRRRRSTLTRRAKHTNANAIRHVTRKATRDAKIALLSTHDQHDTWGAKTGATVVATRDKNVTVLKMIALPITLAYVVAPLCFGNDQNSVFDNQRDVAREFALVCFALYTSKLNNFNLNPLGVVSRYRDSQLQVGKN